MELVEKFFTADLTLAEEETLDGLLASSMEAANLFAEKAAENYGRFGLPDPENQAGEGSGKRWGLGLLALALILALGYGWRPIRNRVSPFFPGIHSWLPGAHLSKPFNGKNPGIAPTAHSAKEPSSDEGTEVKALSPGENNNAGTGSGHEMRSLTAPPVMKTPAGSAATGLKEKGHSRLRVNVAITQDGPVTVEILDSQGSKVKSLYTGFLPAGSYSFSWDGKLEDGFKALPGDYRIETRSGSNVQTQDFSIGNKGKN